jgi:hypothetical protein
MIIPQDRDQYVLFFFSLTQSWYMMSGLLAFIISSENQCTMFDEPSTQEEVTFSSFISYPYWLEVYGWTSCSACVFFLSYICIKAFVENNNKIFIFYIGYIVNFLFRFSYDIVGTYIYFHTIYINCSQLMDIYRYGFALVVIEPIFLLFSLILYKHLTNILK